MNQPLIYLITDGSLNPDNYSAKIDQIVDLITVAVACDVPLIQIREKNLPTRLLFELTKKIVEIKQNSPTKILVNDRADVALAANADGVHLTTNSLSVKIIRQNFPENFIIGVSTHTIPQAVAAKNDGANFTVFAPIFETPGKGNPQGTQSLAEVVAVVNDFPVIALGGITDENFVDVLRAGASGIAAIRWLNDAQKLPKIVEQIRKKSNE